MVGGVDGVLPDAGPRHAAPASTSTTAGLRHASTASRRWPTCGRATTSTTRTAAGAPTRPATSGASAASRTSSSARSTERSTRARATRSPSIGSSTPGSPRSRSTTSSPPTTSSASGAAFRSFDPGSLDTYSLPTRPGSAGGASILRLQDEEAQPILDRFRGTDQRRLRTARRAGAGAQRLRAHRPRRPDQRRARRRRVRRGGHGRGRALRRHRDARALHAGERGQGRPGGALPRSRAPGWSWSRGPLDADVVVVTGTLLTGVRAEPRPPGPSTTASTTTTTTAASTSTTIAASTSTTTRPPWSATCPRRPRASTAEPTAPDLAGLRPESGPICQTGSSMDASRARSPTARAPGRGDGRDEGDRARRWAGHSPEPRQPGDVEAAHARLRQAARLLPDQHAAARPHQRDPDHLEPRAAAAVRGAPRRRPPVGVPLQLRRAAGAERHRVGLPDRRGVHRRRRRRPGPRRQHLLRRGARRAAAAVHEPEGRRGVRPVGARSGALRRARVRRRRRGGGRAREAGRPAVELHDPGPLLLRQQRGGGGRVDRARAPAASSRSAR